MIEICVQANEYALNLFSRPGAELLLHLAFVLKFIRQLQGRQDDIRLSSNLPVAFEYVDARVDRLCQ